MMKDVQPNIVKIYCRVQLTHMLRDTRYNRYCCVFGAVKSVSRQYGIKIKKLDNCYEFSAPKSRMQLFAEKLHFAGIHFSESPF